MRILILAIAALVAQAPPAAPPTGTITVERAGKQSAAIAEGIERALRDRAFVVLPAPSKSRYIARFTVDRHTKGIVAADGREAPSSVSQTGNWGARLRTTLPSHKTDLHGLVVTNLTIEIVERATLAPVWHGSAITAQVESSDADTPAAIADKLAGPLIGRFPAATDRPITIP